MNNNNRYIDLEGQIKLIQGAYYKLMGYMIARFPAEQGFRVEIEFHDELQGLRRRIASDGNLLHREFMRFIDDNEFIISAKMLVTRKNFAGLNKRILKMQRHFFRDASGSLLIHHDFLVIHQKEYRGVGIAAEVLQATDDISDKIGVSRILLEAGKDNGGITWIKRGYVPFKSFNNIALRSLNDIGLGLSGLPGGSGYVRENNLLLLDAIKARLGGAGRYSFMDVFGTAFYIRFSADAVRRRMLLDMLGADDVVAFSDYALTAEFADNFAFLFHGSWWLGSIDGGRLALLKTAGYFTDPVQQMRMQKGLQSVVRSGYSGLAGVA